MVEVQGLVKTFGRGKPPAVNALSFRVEPGQIYALLGPNGAGKTTTLRILTTLLRPTEGKAIVAGVDVVAEPLKARQRLAWVPAETGLPDRLTVREVIETFARIQGVSAPQKRASELLERLGAATYADKWCSDLSTGMKRRVVLARALVHDPPVLFLDEPTDGLDVPGRRDILSFITEQAQLGRTVVVSSHIMGEIERLDAQIGLVRDGTLAAEGTAKELMSRSNTTNLDDAFLALVENQ